MKTVSYTIPSLKLTVCTPLKIGRNPIGQDRIPIIHFQGLSLAVSFREGKFQQKKLSGFSHVPFPSPMTPVWGPCGVTRRNPRYGCSPPPCFMGLWHRGTWAFHPFIAPWNWGKKGPFWKERKGVVFQPSIFRCKLAVSFGEGIPFYSRGGSKSGMCFWLVFFFGCRFLMRFGVLVPQITNMRV